MSDEDMLSSPLGGASVLAIPARLWQLYIDYLWHPTPGSWVRSAAQTFAWFAALVILPFALLTLLDVMSYVIARTLGVVESTKASTNDKRIMEEVVLRATDGPSDVDENVRGGHVMAGGGGAGETAPIQVTVAPANEPPRMKIDLSDAQTHLEHQALIDSGPSTYFFSPSEERNLELSGANVLSPAVSRQGSPPIERRSQHHSKQASVSYGEDGSLSESYVLMESNQALDEAVTRLRRRGGVISETTPVS